MSKKVFYKVNHFIQANELRVIGDQGQTYGVLSKSEALAKANELGVDLVEIAPNAVPPVAKLINFAKFKYQIQQKIQDDRKKTKNAEIKEIRFTPFIAENDFQNRVRKASDYLKDGDKVKLVVIFKGRQITRKDFGDAILQKATKALEEIGKVEVQPRLMGKMVFTQIAPSKKKKTESSTTQTEEDSKE